MNVNEVINPNVSLTESAVKELLSIKERASVAKRDLTKPDHQHRLHSDIKQYETCSLRVPGLLINPPCLLTGGSSYCIQGQPQSMIDSHSRVCGMCPQYVNAKHKSVMDMVKTDDRMDHMIQRLGASRPPPMEVRSTAMTAHPGEVSPS